MTRILPAAIVMAGCLGLLSVVSAKEPVRETTDPPKADQDRQWAQDFSHTEVQRLIRNGPRIIIVGVGGVERNRLLMLASEQDCILRTSLTQIAREIPDSLIAPIVNFVPEDDAPLPPAGKQQFPGVMSLDSETFEALLTDICRNYRRHGFEDILLLGDSPSSQPIMSRVADDLNEEWKASGDNARVHYSDDYYAMVSYEFPRRHNYPDVLILEPEHRRELPERERERLEINRRRLELDQKSAKSLIRSRAWATAHEFWHKRYKSLQTDPYGEAGPMRQH